MWEQTIKPLSISADIRRFVLISNKQFRQAILAFIIIALPSFFITGNYIVADAPVPKEGMEENPFPDQPLSEGVLMIVLDGGRKDMMSDHVSTIWSPSVLRDMITYET